MLGLMFLLGIAVFIAVVIGAGIGAKNAAQKSGKSPKASFWRGVAASTFVLGLVFWDAIPTHIAVWYYRNQTQPLVINKSAEDWLKENKDELPNIKHLFYSAPDTPPYVTAEGMKLVQFNSRIASGSEFKDLSKWLPVRAFVSVIVDTKTGQELVRVTKISSGPIGTWGDGWWKPWLASQPTEAETLADVMYSTRFSPLTELGCKSCKP